MEVNFSGFVIDPTKCSQLSLEEKRELVHEISIWADNAPEILQSWSRRELLQIICAELGKERKYTGLTKPRMIARLLKLMSERNIGRNKDDLPNDFEVPVFSQNGGKKKQKNEKPLLLLPAPKNIVPKNCIRKVNETTVCQNLACRANLTLGEPFCKKCSCCICYCYDDNKDPSLWLVCNSNPPYSSESCGLSCHLTCILKHERAGILKHESQAKLDGAYYCIACGKVNGLIESWRKQLIVAKEARRIDMLCHRISLSYRILKDSEQYRELHSVVNAVAKKLKREVGSLDKVPVEMAQGIVKQLSCAAEVQKLCSLAAEAAESLAVKILNSKSQAACHIQFESISPVSVVVSLDYDEEISGERIVGSRLWHRISGPTVYPLQPTSIIHWPDKCAVVSGLVPSTEYWFKISLFSSTKELGLHETCWIMQAPDGNNFSTSIPGDSHEHGDQPLHKGDEQEGAMHPMQFQSESQRGSTNSSDNHQTPKPPRTGRRNCSKVLSLEDISHNNEKCTPHSSDDVPFVCSNSDPFETPSKSTDLNSLPEATKKGSTECEYEYCVKMIRWLECEGYMEKDFRVKFLTWFSLKATEQERRVVKAFIDVLIDEPGSLVDQLIDAFMEGICNKESAPPTNGFCTRLWH